MKYTHVVTEKGSVVKSSEFNLSYRGIEKALFWGNYKDCQEYRINNL